ncbi:hypothetical protein COOONC_17566 [Cooperia oncophora]
MAENIADDIPIVSKRLGTGAILEEFQDYHDKSVGQLEAQLRETHEFEKRNLQSLYRQIKEDFKQAVEKINSLNKEKAATDSELERLREQLADKQNQGFLMVVSRYGNIDEVEERNFGSVVTAVMNVLAAQNTLIVRSSIQEKVVPLMSLSGDALCQAGWEIRVATTPRNTGYLI